MKQIPAITIWLYTAVFMNLLILPVIPAASQQPYLRTVAYITDFADGQINTISQDNQGFVWFGATSGAYRFDGTDFYAAGLHDSILNKSVTAIWEDQDENIWFGFADGNILYYDGFAVKSFQPKDRLPASKITAITGGRDGSIWFGTYGEGIYVFRKNNIQKINSEAGLSDDYIYCLMADRTEVWAGTDDGINICRFQNELPSIRWLSVADGLPDFIVQALVRDDTGSVWIGMQDKGICRYDPHLGRFNIPVSNDNWKLGSVNDLHIAGHSVWIMTGESGIAEYNLTNGSLKNIHFKGEQSQMRFISMMGDMEGNIWMISNNEVYLSPGPAIEFLETDEGHSFQNIHALITDDGDNLWFANDAGIYCYPIQTADDKGLQFYPMQGFPEINKVMSLYRDNYGFLWIGTFGNGLIRFDPESGQRIVISDKNGLSNGNVLTIKGSATEIWFGTLGGAFRCSIDDRFAKLSFIPEFVSFGEAEGLSNNYIYNLFTDNSGRVWFATDGSGVCYFENGTFLTPEMDSGFMQKIIYSVTAGPDGKVWMNAAQEGLYSYQGNELRRIFHDKEHENLSFSGIITNKVNELVMAYDKGIDVLNSVTGSIRHFENNAGLSAINPDLNTLAVDSEGSTWIGTSKGIIVYRPLTGNFRERPLPKITGVSLYLQRIDFKNGSTFKYRDNHVTFDYSGLWYQFPEQVEYLVKLEGHDLEWMRTRNKNVIYSNLPYGNYTFKVKTGIYENFESAAEDTYSFTILKPIWLSPWFIFMVIMSLITVVFFYIRSREKRLKRKQEAMREKLRFQFENLKSQINPHFLFNSFSTLISLIDLDKNSAIEYVEELSNLFRNVLEFKDQDVITLTEELQIIDNYYKLQKKRYGNNLDLQISEIENQEQIKLPPMTLQLLIENAIKHNVVSKESPLQIRIFADYMNSYLFVDNNLQQKQGQAVSTGIGIRNIIERYNILTDKKIQIVKGEKNFKIGLPFIH